MPARRSVARPANPEQGDNLGGGNASLSCWYKFCFIAAATRRMMTASAACLYAVSILDP
jgi:hypothetical protein